MSRGKALCLDFNITKGPSLKTLMFIIIFLVVSSYTHKPANNSCQFESLYCSSGIYSPRRVGG